MKTPKKYDVFISYSRKDFDEVEALVAQLKQAIPTLSYWFDLTGIESGDDFEERIISAIDNSAFVLFALSENSMQSTWTKDEVMYAKNTGKRVLPVLLNGAVLSDGWFLFKFGRVDCIDSTNPLQVAKLVRNLSQWTMKPMAQFLQEEAPKPLKHILFDVPMKKSASWLKYVLPPLALLVIAGIVYWTVPKQESVAGGMPKAVPNKATSESTATPQTTTPQTATAQAATSTKTYQWVDLGLSVMWAACNVGAESEEQAGDYFAWGETPANKDYGWAAYVHGSASDKLTKYCSDAAFGLNAYTDNKHMLEAQDDAATVNLGNAWRLPTAKEMEELHQLCTWTWSTQKGVNGYKVTSKKNGNSIFLPAAGSFDGKQVRFAGLGGFYWCSNLNVEEPTYAYNLGFNEESIKCSDDGYRLTKRSIRPVCKKSAALKMQKQ